MSLFSSSEYSSSDFVLLSGFSSCRLGPDCEREMETTREYNPKDQHLLVLGGSTDSTCAANHDTGTAASPNYILSLGRCDADMFLGRNRDCTRFLAEPAQRRCPTHTKSTAIRRGESTSLTFFHLPVRPTRSWHRPRHLNLRVMLLFGLSCHVLCHGFDDVMWWHSAAKQVLVARDSISTSSFWNRSTSIGEEFASTTPRLAVFPFKTQAKQRSITHKLHNNTATTTAHLVDGIKLTALLTPTSTPQLFLQEIQTTLDQEPSIIVTMTHSEKLLQRGW